MTWHLGFASKIIPKGMGVEVKTTEDCLKVDSCLSWMTNTRQLILFLFYTLLKVSAINGLKSMWFLPLNSDISSWPHSTVLTLTSDSSGVRVQAAWTERGARGSGRSGGRRGMKAAGEGGGRSLTYSRQRDSGLPCVPETRESEVKCPSTRLHPPGASLPLLAFLHFPFGGAGASLGMRAP